MVKSWWSRGENRRDCDFLNTFPHEKFWGLFSQKKKHKKNARKKMAGFQSSILIYVVN